MIKQTAEITTGIRTQTRTVGTTCQSIYSLFTMAALSVATDGRVIRRSSATQNARRRHTDAPESTKAFGRSAIVRRAFDHTDILYSTTYI